MNKDNTLTEETFAFNQKQFNTLFPFYFIFDKALHIYQAGASLLKIEPNLVAGALLDDFFYIKTPSIPMDYATILQKEGVLHNWILNDFLNIRGQILSIKGTELLIFVGSPTITSIEQLNGLKLSANDFAKHDSTLDQLFLRQAQVTSKNDNERIVNSLQRSIDETEKLEDLQTEMSFELNISYDLKVRFKKDGTILDIQSSSSLPIVIDRKNLIGTNVFSEMPFLGDTLKNTVNTLIDYKQKIPFSFTIKTAENDRYFEARLALDPNQVYLLLANDVTEQQQLKSELTKRSNFDLLTKLPNRNYFLAQVSKILNNPKHGENLYTLMSIDLDNFKNINDSYGHATGDYTLKIIADMLLKNIRSDDVAARFGGDEFAIFISGDMTEESMVLMAQRICKNANQLIKHNGFEFHTGCSIGLTFSKENNIPLDLFCNQADIAMYQAKEQRKGSVSIYQKGMYEKHQKKLFLKDALTKAINTEQITLSYQPVIENKTEKIKGFEALVRWKHPMLGNISPEVFIPIAENNGLMIPLGRHILQRVFKTWAAFLQQNKKAKHLTLAINISSYQLYDCTLSKDLDRLLREYNIDIKQIILEITESALISDIEYAVSLISELKQLGYTIALDDFGTGFSSLNYLDKLPLDILKIDRSFVMKIGNSNDNIPLIESIIGIAKIMKLLVVAEGVETATQQNVLSKLGCEYSQGFYYSKPLDENDFFNQKNLLDAAFFKKKT